MTYRCPFCYYPMPLCRTLGIFSLRYPNGRLERKQRDHDGVEIA